MIEFRPALQKRVYDILLPAVGPDSDPEDTIQTFDTYLHDVDISALPFLVINVRMNEKLLAGEIGNQFQKYTWTVHIYYLDMATVTTPTPVNFNQTTFQSGVYSQADIRRDHIMARIEKKLELRKFLELDDGQALRTIDTDGHQEVVYDSAIQAITFDSSGQEGHQSFVSELYFEVYTDRS